MLLFREELVAGIAQVGGKGGVVDAFTGDQEPCLAVSSDAADTDTECGCLGSCGRGNRINGPAG
jgi:hypothetical protein